MSKREAGDESSSQPPAAKRPRVEALEGASAAAAAPRALSSEDAWAIALTFATARLAQLDDERARGGAAADGAADDARQPRGRHECPELACGADFASPSKLKQHVDAVHRGLKPHACSHCEAAFATSGHLNMHLSAVHLGLKPHACRHCDATFATSGHLKAHLSAVHLGLKPHACSQCEATFATSNHLNMHLSAVHLGLKPHECEWCVAAYKSSSSLKAHMASAHPGVPAH